MNASTVPATDANCITQAAPPSQPKHTIAKASQTQADAAPKPPTEATSSPPATGATTSKPRNSSAEAATDGNGRQSHTQD